MADRGTTVAYDATQTPVGVFEHVMEPTAAFPGTLTYQDADETSVELAAYGHPFDGPAGASDFGAFTIDGSGTGYYMTPADTTQEALQAAPNGRAAVAGALTMTSQVEASVAGAATVAAAALSKDYLLLPTATNGRSTPSTPSLRRLVDLGAAQVDGSSAHPATSILGKLGAYRAAVLASNPSFLLHLNESSGTNFLNDPSLGGSIVADTTGSGRVSLARFPNGSLLQTEVGYTFVGDGSALDTRIATFASASPVSLAYSAEWWFHRQFQSSNTDLSLIATATSGATSDIFQIYSTFAGNGRLAIYRTSPQGFSGPGYVSVITSKRIDDNQPHHIVVTYDPAGNGTLSLYLDGVLDAQATATEPRATDNVNPTWGTPPQWRSYGWSHDELAWYPRTLAASEVVAHYDAAWFSLRLRAAGISGASTPTANLGFVGGQDYALDGAVVGLAASSGNLEILTGQYHALSGTLVGASAVAAQLRLMRLNMHQPVTTPRARARFVRARV